MKADVVHRPGTTPTKTSFGARVEGTKSGREGLWAKRSPGVTSHMYVRLGEQTGTKGLEKKGGGLRGGGGV